MLGDDVVDLLDAEAAAGATHPRFDRRVFTDAERARLERSREPQRLRWTLWAAKESCFKAVRRLDPSVIFAPARFLVHLEGARRATVVHDGQRFGVAIELHDGLVHAVAVAAGAPAAEIVAASFRVGDGEPSTAARALAIDRLAPRLAVDPARLTIVRQGRIPALCLDGRPSGVALSLSHHGRGVGFAARVPLSASRPARAERPPEANP